MVTHGFQMLPASPSQVPQVRFVDADQAGFQGPVFLCAAKCLHWLGKWLILRLAAKLIPSGYD